MSSIDTTGTLVTDEYKKDLEQLAEPNQNAVHVEKSNGSVLTPQHQEYLIQRHGTLELDPVPSMSQADPYNWPQWKKVVNLSLVAFHAFMTTFTAASIQSAYANIAEDLNVSMQTTAYLTSLQIAILGVGPLIWTPFANRFGRRPILLISLVGSAVGNIGCAVSPTYSAMAGCRAVVAFFISPPSGLGGAVVAETFFKGQRARYMGVWTLLVTLGVPVAPFIFGFVAQRVDYRWIYWVLAITNGVQFVLYLCLGPETLFNRKQETIPAHRAAFKQEFLTFRRINPEPFNFKEFVSPLFLFFKSRVFIPAAAYAMVFLFGSILLSVEIPSLFEEKFGLDTQQIGLQFLGLLIGSVIGEQLGGVLSDTWMRRRSRRLGHWPQPEFRLWLSYPGYLLTICGMVVFLVQFEKAQPGHWNVTPVVGSGIAAAGNQLVTTVCITYAVDSYDGHAASVGTFIGFVRSIWGFIGPFWFPSMFANVGLLGSAGIVAGLIVAVSILPTMYLQLRYRSKGGRS